MHRNFSVVVLAIFLPLGAIFAAARTDPSITAENRIEELTGGLSPSVLIFILALTTAIIFMGLITIYMICYHRCPQAIATSDPPLRVLQPLPPALAERGIDASVVETFPAFVYAEVKSSKIGKGALECAVCLNEFEDHETLRLLPKCDHVFHTRCIDAWLSSHTTCPVCRSDLAAEPAAERIIHADASGVESQAEGEIHEPAVHIVPNQHNGDSTLGTALAATSIRLLRWNSTGHSLVGKEENTDWFTLKLPEKIKKQLIINSPQTINERNLRWEKRLNRWQTMSDRWLNLKISSFDWSNGSMKSPKGISNISKGISVQSATPEERKCDSVQLPV